LKKIEFEQNITGKLGRKVKSCLFRCTRRCLHSNTHAAKLCVIAPNVRWMFYMKRSPNVLYESQLDKGKNYEGFLQKEKGADERVFAC
jgi:hypothetical protein